MRLYAIIAVGSMGLAVVGWAYWQGYSANKMRDLRNEKTTMERINEALGRSVDPSDIDSRLRDLAE